jgi:hypothetical protein
MNKHKRNGFRVVWLVAFEAVLSPVILVVGQMSSFYIAVPLVLIPALYGVKKLSDMDDRIGTTETRARKRSPNKKTRYSFRPAFSQS